METIKINKQQNLYVINCGKGYTCLGFENCKDKAIKLNAELNYPVKLARIGTKKLYTQYLSLVRRIAAMNKQTGYQSIAGLIPEFIGKEGRRVEVVTSYGEKSRFIIGKSTGFIPCHLEIKKSNSSGGAQVMGWPFKSITFLS